MSFDFNPMQNLSNVQASSKACAGGGGNTGYFKRGESEEENIEFPRDYPDDSFERQEDADEIQKESLLSIIKGLFLDFVDWIKSLFLNKTD